MTKFKFKGKTWHYAIAIILAVLCFIIITICSINASRAVLAIDLFTSIFLIVIQILFLFAISTYLFFSGYTIYTDKLVIKNAIFKDVISFKDISKILFFVSENELYILKKDDSHVKINIDSASFQDFTKSIRALDQAILYEVSFKLEEQE